MKKVSLLAVCLLVILTLAFTGTAGANLQDCSKCHGTTISDFTVAPPVPAQTCRTCHDEITMDPYHSYPSWIATYVSNAGYFKTTSSVFTKPPLIHTNHRGTNKPANSGGYCRYCHKPATCETCHKTVGHKLHGNIPSSTFPKYYVATGTGYVSQSLSCSLSSCHKFYSTGGIISVRPDGKQLCLNCHITDKTGHTDANLAPLHNSTSGTLMVGATSYNVSCTGCHAGSLTTEHKAAVVRLGQPEDAECGYCHMASAQPAVATVVNQIKNANKIVTDLAVKAQNRACGKCHFNTNVLILPTEHPNLYHIATGSNNLNLVGGPHATCDTCHGRQDLWPVISTLATSSPKNYSCLDCHKEAFNLAPKHKAIFDDVETNLIDLHAGCDTCHTPGPFADKVGVIITNLKNGAETYACTDCHSGDTLNAGHKGPLDTNCTQTCHKATLTEDHLNNDITQVNHQDDPLTCGSCHQSADVEVKLAISNGNTDCAACHAVAHGINLVQQIPADIPLYPGYQWSAPQSVQIWASEPWMPAGYEGGRILISNRMTGVTGTDIWNFYKQNMTGWTGPATEPDAASNFFSAEFTKDKRKVAIFFYGGENHTASPAVASGFRLEIMYK